MGQPVLLSKGEDGEGSIVGMIKEEHELEESSCWTMLALYVLLCSIMRWGEGNSGGLLVGKWNWLLVGLRSSQLRETIRLKDMIGKTHWTKLGSCMEEEKK